MDYINTFLDYLKTLFNNYVYSRQNHEDLNLSIEIVDEIKIIDEKIGNINDTISILNELKPMFLPNLKKKYKFSEKILFNINEIIYVIKNIENWKSENSNNNVNLLSVNDVIVNTNMDFLYKKMLLIKERYEILNRPISDDD